MGIFELVAILLMLAATFSYINYQFLKLPAAIGLMALVASLGLLIVGQFVPASSSFRYWRKD